MKYTFQYLEDEWIKGYWKFVCNNKDKIDWDWLSFNPNITWEIIQNNLDKNWMWGRPLCEYLNESKYNLLS